MIIESRLQTNMVIGTEMDIAALKKLGYDVEQMSVN